MRKSLVVICLTIGGLYAINGPTFFGKFPNRYFIETGTDLGAGVREAIKAGFSSIHSIEIDRDKALKRALEFKKYNHVKIWHGDSTLLLKKIIESIHEPITFWLDAHRMQELQSDHLNTAILTELEQIKEHPIKTHTVLIDDMRIFGTAEHNYITVQQLIDKIKEINKDYVIRFIDGAENDPALKNDVLVAQVR